MRRVGIGNGLGRVGSRHRACYFIKRPVKRHPLVIVNYPGSYINSPGCSPHSKLYRSDNTEIPLTNGEHTLAVDYANVRNVHSEKSFRISTRYGRKISTIPAGNPRTTPETFGG